jgi:hypothetical protein
MDKRISPQDLAVLDRRQLLRGAAAATAIRALPASERAVAAPQEIEAANLVGWSHFSAATLRRLEEIALRNRLRKEAGLPLLSVVKELQCMKTVEDGERFNQFVALHEKAVWDEVLKSVRGGMGDANWSLNSITGGNSSERVGNSQTDIKRHSHRLTC